MSNPHHKTKTRQGHKTDSFQPAVRDAPRLIRSDDADAVEAAMNFEDAKTTDGGYGLALPRPVSERYSLTGGSLR